MIHLTVEQAYQAMLVFLDKEYNLTKSDDIGAFLGGCQLTSEGVTMDPAAWKDWLSSVSCILNSQKKPNF